MDLPNNTNNKAGDGQRNRAERVNVITWRSTTNGNLPTLRQGKYVCVSNEVCVLCKVTNCFCFVRVFDRESSYNVAGRLAEKQKHESVGQQNHSTWERQSILYFQHFPMVLWFTALIKQNNYRFQNKENISLSNAKRTRILTIPEFLVTHWFYYGIWLVIFSWYSLMSFFKMAFSI